MTENNPGPLSEASKPISVNARSPGGSEVERANSGGSEPVGTATPSRVETSEEARGVRFEQVWKLFGEEAPAVADLNLKIREGEFLVLVGPSGCGKTTSLRMLAGLERPTYGRIWFGSRDVTTLSPGERDVAMVFQSYALYPNMTVYKNLAFGPTVRKESKTELRRRIDEVAAILGIEKLLNRRPTELSGGQRQRVALGRALLRESRLFLLDEPLSNLDAALRVQMRSELIRLHNRLVDTTTVYVTHDQIEALTMGDRVAVLKDGSVMQCDTPSGLYENPSNAFVASFIGSPKMNLVPGELHDEAGRMTLRLLGTDVSLHPLQAQVLRRWGGQSPNVGIRPMDLRPPVDVAGSAHSGRVQGLIEVVEHTGSEIFATTRVQDRLIMSRFPRTLVPLSGERTELAFNPNHLYFFSPETGEALIDRHAVLRDLGEAPREGALPLSQAQR